MMLHHGSCIGPPVKVGILPDESGFYVEDTGPGIPEEDHEEVLEPEYSTAEDGTGFGLAIVKEIVEAHGGRFTPPMGLTAAHGLRLLAWNLLNKVSVSGAIFLTDDE